MTNIIDDIVKNISIVGEVDTEFWSRPEAFWPSKESADVRLDLPYKQFGFTSKIDIDTFLTDIKLKDLSFFTKSINDKQKFINICCGLLFADSDLSKLNAWATEVLKIEPTNVILDTTELIDKEIVVKGVINNYKGTDNNVNNQDI